jgi:hypothetical protein
LKPAPDGLNEACMRPCTWNRAHLERATQRNSSPAAKRAGERSQGCLAALRGRLRPTMRGLAVGFPKHSRVQQSYGFCGPIAQGLRPAPRETHAGATLRTPSPRPHWTG